jgi:DnaJ-domain-containing protein 1
VIRILIMLIVIAAVWLLLRKTVTDKKSSGWNPAHPDERARYCEILGVSLNAGGEAVKNAYRNKIKEYHPDMFLNQPEWVKKQAVEMTQKINEAYRYLKTN